MALKTNADKFIDRLVSIIVTIIVWGFSIGGLLLFIREAEPEFSTAFPSFIRFITKGSNVNRLGLVFQFIGIFAAFPELVKRSDSNQWERWFHKVGSNTEIANFSIRDLFLIKPVDFVMTRGPLGLVNLISRSIVFYFIVTALQVLWGNVQGFDFDIALSAHSLVIFISIGLTLWLFCTFYDLRNALRNVETSKEFNRTYLLLSLPLIFNSLLIYIPVTLIVLIVLSSLRGISDYSIEQIITKATFPFVLFGSLLELAATFI